MPRGRAVYCAMAHTHGHTVLVPEAWGPSRASRCPPKACEEPCASACASILAGGDEPAVEAGPEGERGCPGSGG
jgi:hypothetical protein